MSRHRTRSVTRHPTATATATTRDHYMKLNKISRGVSPARADGWMVALARDARDARDGAMDATRCISMYYIYIHRRRRRVVVIVASSSCPYPNASIARDTHACIHPSIHPSIHPPIHRATRRDATLPATSRRCTQKKSHARKYYDAYDDANTTYLDLRRLEGGDAGDEGGREEGRHRVCVCVRECRARRDRGGGGGRRRFGHPTTPRVGHPTHAWRRPCGPPPSSVVDGSHRSMGHRVPVVVIGHIFERSGHTRDRPRGRWCVCVYSI